MLQLIIQHKLELLLLTSTWVIHIEHGQGFQGEFHWVILQGKRNRNFDFVGRRAIGLAAKYLTTSKDESEDLLNQVSILCIALNY